MSTYKEAFIEVIDEHIAEVKKDPDKQVALFDNELPGFYLGIVTLLLSQSLDDRFGDGARAQFFKDHNIEVENARSGIQVFMNTEKESKDLLCDLLCNMLDINPDETIKEGTLDGLKSRINELLNVTGKYAKESMDSFKARYHKANPKDPVKFAGDDKAKTETGDKDSAKESAHFRKVGDYYEIDDSEFLGPEAEKEAIKQEILDSLPEGSEAMLCDVSDLTNQMGDRFFKAFANQVHDLAQQDSYGEKFYIKTISDVAYGLANHLVSKKFIEQNTVKSMAEQIRVGEAFCTGMCAMFTAAIMHKEPNIDNVLANFGKAFTQYLDATYPEVKDIDCLKDKIETAYMSFEKQQVNKDNYNIFGNDGPDFPDDLFGG